MRVSSVQPALRADFVHLSIFQVLVWAGFPSPAEDFQDKPLDLHQHLVSHPTATFFMRVQGHSMTQAGIRSGDLLVVDRSINPTDGVIVVAVLDGTFTVKRLSYKGKKVYLMAASASYPPIEISEDRDFEVWGVVAHVIHSF